MTATVGDLFCGAGGFSEGFRQAGFEVVWAVDNWRPAVDTFRHNFPRTNVIEADISSFDLRKLEPVDVIVGGPPCTYFSLANKAGNGNKIAGLALVKKFAEAIKQLQPRYWVMENVANIRPALENGLFTDSDLFSQRTLINAADYGVPQSRRRLFSGKFPVPSPVAEGPYEWTPMGRIIDGLPCPLIEAAGTESCNVQDPLYHFEIPVEALRDHFMNTVLTEAQIDSCIRGRKHHPWGGPMRFPDSLEIPARTALATSPKGNRGAIVLEEKRVSPRVYRTPTVRESACMQGFPITFQFWGRGAHKNQELVGNAVPPPVARSIAHSILGDLGQVRNVVPKFELPSELPPLYLLSRSERPFKLTRPYRRLIPGTVRNQCSVNLDNRGTVPARHPAFGVPHLVQWRTTLYVGYAKDVVSFAVDLDTAWKLALSVANFVEGGVELVERITVYAAKEFAHAIPDASTLQAAWAWRFRRSSTPDELIILVARLCRDVLGKKSDSIYSVEASRCSSLLSKHQLYHGKNFSLGRWKKRRITFFAACALVGLSIAVSFANEGSLWLLSHWRRSYRGEPFDPLKSRITSSSGVTAPKIMESFRTLKESFRVIDEPSVLSFLPCAS